MLETKKCFKCGSELPRTEFYKHPMMSDGLLSKCKTCTKRDVRENRLANIEHYKEFDKKRAMLPHRVAERKAYQATDRGKEAARKGSRNYVIRNPVKKSATTAVNNAIRDGRLVKHPCEVCGNPKAQAHHDDYGKPLEVRWLCTAHHAAWHKANKAICPPQQPTWRDQP